MIDSLEALHYQLSSHAARQVDQFMTYRNWLLGLYIVDLEQYSEGRAACGHKLFPWDSLEFLSPLIYRQRVTFFVKTQYEIFERT